MLMPSFYLRRTCGFSIALFCFGLTPGVIGALSTSLNAAPACPQSGSPTSGKPQAEELTPPPPSLTIQPAAVVIVAGEPQRLRLSDNLGRRVSGAVWTVSAPARAEIKVDREAMITGLAPGIAVVTAT